MSSETVSDERLASLVAAIKADCSHGSRVWNLADQIETTLIEQSLRSKPVAGVEVKPLEWSKTSYGRPEVETVVGVYRVFEHVDGGWAATFKTFNLVDAHGRKNFATEHEALAAAEADYRQRILSTLLPKATAPAIETRNDEAGFVEFLNEDVPTVTREIDGPCAILLDLNTRQIVGYRVYDPATAPVVSEPVAWQRKLRKRGTPGWGEWKECTKSQADYAEAYGHPQDFEEVEAVVRPLYASPQPEVVITEERVERALKKSPKFWRETSEAQRHMRAALTAALKES